ncbi:MAG: hypothetical protein ACK42C_01970 [Aquificaceae bacterium]
MKRPGPKSFLLYVILVFVFFVLLTFLTFPKFLFLDKKLSESGLYLTANSVHEGYLNLNLRGVNIYDQTSRLLRFDALNIYAGFLKLNFYGLCEGKTLKGELSPWAIKLRAQDFTCFSSADSTTADITLREGIYGTLLMNGLKLQDAKLDQLSLEMRGRVFTARAKFMGFELVGDGQIVYKPSDPLKSQINGRVSGGGMSLTISGTLERLQLRQ